MTTPDYRFCPRCSTPLVERADPAADGGRIRQACPDPVCGFVHWNNPLPVVAAIVEYGDKILLARNAAWPEGMFALITGFLEHGETPEQGIAREVLEETGLVAEDVTLVGVYEFIRKNELIIAYHVRASGAVTLSPELLEYRLVDPPKLRPWRAGTGYAVADWMRERGLHVEFVDRPGQERAGQEGHGQEGHGREGHGRERASEEAPGGQRAGHEASSQ